MSRSVSVLGHSSFQVISRTVPGSEMGLALLAADKHLSCNTQSGGYGELVPYHDQQYLDCVHIDRDVFNRFALAACLYPSTQHAICTSATSFRYPCFYHNLIIRQYFDMATQKALVVQEVGKPLVLVQDRLVPEPGHGQVQIKVTVAGKSNACRIAINSIDS
jgi:hypothetical protein